MGDSGRVRTGRSRWAAIGAACAVSLGAGGMLTASATVDSGARPVFISITPCRMLDTRSGAGAPVGPGATLTVGARSDTGGCATVPADAIGLSLNVAIVSPDADSFLTVFAADVARPLAANANWVARQAPTSNAVNTKISADGRISFFNFAGNVHVIADVNGYYVDHTHDDRYYTRTQIDRRINFAWINGATGGLIDSTPGWTSARQAGSPQGVYILTAPFNLLDAHCSPTASITPIPGTPIENQARVHVGYVLDSTFNHIRIEVFGANNVPINSSVSVHVLCM